MISRVNSFPMDSWKLVMVYGVILISLQSNIKFRKKKNILILSLILAFDRNIHIILIYFYLSSLALSPSCLRNSIEAASFKTSSLAL